ncbi:aldo/keto reductase [Sediminitomix flava]|uniref:Aryl-alcohol dehydrogenase-like predicted oxidoreductase n=1 Tax=Sediminitomix flava TaxID=379075 RepID=A0A315Z520_SEDFL|nr:aldo/keto reductase [Sediminitomix flava]PWJ37915.1 aryl-alcohol dehydrogenase-like predicted oxidoreductase [Sediminitomix flava]
MISTIAKPTYQADVYQESKLFSHGTRLVLGTSGLGGVWGEVDEDESVGCILYALEHGILSLDTAPSYNRSQEFVGKALKQWDGEKPYISTKIGRLFAEKADDFNLDYSRDGMLRSMENSLETLGVDQVDLLFLHEPHLTPIAQKDEILETLNFIKEQGWTKKIGVGGNPTPEFYPFMESGLFEVISGFTKMDACNMSAFEKDIPLIQEKGHAYYAASALHMGLLGRRFDEYCKERPNNEWISNKDVDVAIKIKSIADELDIDLAEMALRYLMSVKEANRVVIGARKSDQIQTTVDYWRKGALSEEVFNRITDTIYQ